MSLAVKKDSRSLKTFQKCGDARGEASKCKQWARQDIKHDTPHGQRYISEEHLVLQMCAMPKMTVQIEELIDLI